MIARLHRLLEGRRLSTRMVALSLALLLAVQAAAFVVIRSSIERNARATLAEELAVGERVWQRLLSQRADRLTQAATLLAADYGFRSAVGSGDTDTQRSALDNHAARIGAPLAALLDTGFVPRATATADGDGALLALVQALAPALARHGHQLALAGGRPYQFVIAPVKAPLTVGWVVMGFPIDAALLADMRAVSGLHVALGRHDAAGGGGLLATTLGREQAAQLRFDTAAREHEQSLAGDLCVARDASPVGAPWRVLLLRSVDEAVEPYRALQATLALITLGGVLLFGLGSVWTARHVTRPLRALVRASERLAAGHYDEPLPPAARRDEIGDLAQAFDRMRVSIAAQRDEITDLAFRDRLTGLPNRLQFRQRVREAMAAGPCAVLLLNLDRFKHVNDVLGYAFGDHLLRAVADRLRALPPAGGLLARLGGDEFALLLPGADAAAAMAHAARLLKAFEAPLRLDEQSVDLGAGLGIAAWPGHRDEHPHEHPHDPGDADALIGRAEVAMVAAKRRGAGVLAYDPALDTASAETLSLLGELRRALEHDELRLYLQPKIDLHAGADAARVVGAEALVRWQHPQRGLVPPMQFIPFAEQTGFIRALTLWMFGQAAAAMPRLRARGVQRVSVNLSTRDLLDLELPDKLDALLARHGARAGDFCLEITESAIMDDPQRAQGTLERLAARGFKLSIDDFGTGYSSLAYLKRLPVDELKIDKSFVMPMARDQDDAKIVRSTIDLAHNLGLTVVAEGVESAAIAHALAALGCDEAQGYHYGRPVPLADLLARLPAPQENALAALAD